MVKNYDEIKSQAEVSPRKLTLQAGRRLVYADLEDDVYKWVMGRCEAELAVSTQHIIDKALCLDPTFREGDVRRLFLWVHQFMKRRRLCVRTRTSVSQQTRNVMESVKRDICKRVMTTFRNRIKNPRLLVNMDETAIYLNCSPKRTVYGKGERTVSIRIGGTSSMRFTPAVTVAMDGTKLPLFAIFKGTPGGSVENST